MHYMSEISQQPFPLLITLLSKLTSAFKIDTDDDSDSHDDQLFEGVKEALRRWEARTSRSTSDWIPLDFDSMDNELDERRSPWALLTVFQSLSNFSQKRLRGQPERPIKSDGERKLFQNEGMASGSTWGVQLNDIDIAKISFVT
jgi:hypothetical protein